MPDNLHHLNEQIKMREVSLKDKLKQDAPLLYWAMQYHRNIRGDRMSFKDSPYLISIYRDFLKFHKLAIMKPVQRGMSELYIVASFYEAGELGYVVMYVLPKYKGRDRFVTSRVDRVIKKVPYYSKLIHESAGASRIALKGFGKGQIVYVGSNVEDEFIEIPIDAAFVDEQDRCNQKNLLLLPDRYSASPHKFHREISTPTVEGRGIDATIQKSTKGYWFIRCEHCGYRFVPDFFDCVVKEVETGVWKVRDQHCDDTDEPSLICPKCGKRVNRFQEGEYVEEFPGREWTGRIIPGTITPGVPLRKLVNDWKESSNNPQKKEFFYNSELGLPYTSEGAKFSDKLLANVEKPYKWPVDRSEIRGPLFMGVDVGASLTVVIRERVTDEHSCIVYRLVYATELPSFTLLRSTLKEWNPRICVIDADPEIHNVASLKEDFKQVYASRFQHGLQEIRIDRDNHKISEDRTSAIDSMKSSFENGEILNPEGAVVLVGGRYYSQMKASTRILLINENNPEKSYYDWEETTPDHFMLAETYCHQAHIVSPGASVLDYYAQVAKETSQSLAGNVLSSVSGKEMTQEDVAKLSMITPDQFLKGLNKH